MAKHWIAMAGISGCIPSFCQSCDTKEDAIEVLVSLHPEIRGLQAELRRDHYSNRVVGNDYASIQVCHCDEREVHDDF